MISMNDEYREVNFKKYCPNCKFNDIPENKNPCCECLDEPTNHESCVPVRFVKKGVACHAATDDLTKEEKAYLRAIGVVFDID